MTLFVVRRLLWTVPILLAVFTITFFMLRAIGGNPFRHGPLLGHGNPNWAKYNDPQPDAANSPIWSVGRACWRTISATVRSR
jgi:hypothetical protein